MTEALNIKIPHGGYVLVGDGRRALVLRNEGHALHVSLKVQHLFEAPPNPPTREQGTDRPPRVQQGERRSAIAQTDWHEIAEHRFAEEVAALRHALSDRLKRVVIAEIDKDLTKLPIEEIGQRLTHR